MFGNFSAQAGVIASNVISSPNIIQPTLVWNFNNVLILDFNPPGIENLNDRPRINSWRNNGGTTDLSYLKFLSGGKTMLSPAPTGFLIEPWGDRNTGSIRLPQTSIGGSKTAGVDLFTHNFATPINLSPSLPQWSIDGTSVTGEIKYQYLFKTGAKYPVINIELDYKNNCKPVNIPNCNPLTELLVYRGTGVADGCPLFSCISRSSFTSFSEIGGAYTNDWNTGLGKALFGTWEFISGSGSFRTISPSTQFGRQSIGSLAFFIVGNTGNLNTGHIVNFKLVKSLNSGASLSFDVNYAYNGGSREVIFRGANNSNQYRFFHGNANNNLLYFRSGVTNGSSGTGNVLITGNAYLKAFNYKVTNLGTGMEMRVTSSGFHINPLYLDTITGNGIDWSNFVTGISFITNTNNLPQVDWFNYGMYFNNIQFESLAPPITELFATNITFSSFRINWNDVYGASGYRLDVATDSNFTNYVPGFNNKPVIGLSHLVENLSRGTNYYVRARSVNSKGISQNSPILNVKTVFDSIILRRNIPGIDTMGDVAGCQKLLILNYTNTGISNLNYTIVGDVDDDLIINNVTYENGLYPFPWGFNTCGKEGLVNGAHSITPYNGTLAPGQTLKLEAVSYDGIGGSTLLRYDLALNIQS